MFKFKRFTVDDGGCGMKIGTDSVLLGAWALLPQSGLIADLGAGSGLLSLMCAQRSAEARIDAVEVDEGACRSCRANVAASDWSERIEVRCLSAFDYALQAKADFIISNPPYFTTGLLSPDASRAEARHALQFGPKAVIDIASEVLAEQGGVAMITPYDGWQSLLAHAELNRLKLRRCCAVATVEGKAPARMLWQLSRQDGPIEKDTLHIRHADGAYSQKYVALTKDFYLNF